MPATPRPDRYSSVSIVLHWLMLALVTAVYATAELREGYARGSAQADGLAAWHYTLGLSVFALVWVRLVALLFSPVPAPVEAGWRHVLSRITHGMLYVLMLGMPIAGWIILSAEGEVIPFFGVALPALVGPDHGLAEAMEEIHEVGGTIGYWLIGLHAAAALFHHYVLRDGLLARMLPRQPRTGA